MASSAGEPISVIDSKAAAPTKVSPPCIEGSIMAGSGFIPKFLEDPYDRPARLYTSLLVVVPLAVLVVCLYGAANIALSSVLSILGFSGAAYALGRVARNAGKRIQEELFDKWGGAPTTQMLRHRDTSIDIHTKERFHRVLAKGIKKDLPTVTPNEMTKPPQMSWTERPLFG
jgi:hypothetical protein